MYRVLVDDRWEKLKLVHRFQTVKHTEKKKFFMWQFKNHFTTLAKLDVTVSDLICYSLIDTCRRWPWLVTALPWFPNYGVAFMCFIYEIKGPHLQPKTDLREKSQILQFKTALFLFVFSKWDQFSSIAWSDSLETYERDWNFTLCGVAIHILYRVEWYPKLLLTLYWCLMVETRCFQILIN